MHGPSRLVNCANNMHLPPTPQGLQRAVQKRAQPTTRPGATILTFRLSKETRQRQGLRADVTRARKIRHSRAQGTIPSRPRPGVATSPSFSCLTSSRDRQPDGQLPLPLWERGEDGGVVWGEWFIWFVWATIFHSDDPIQRPAQGAAFLERRIGRFEPCEWA